MSLPTYEERLEFIAFPDLGVRYLLPSGLDLATQRAFITSLEEALEEFDRQEPPPDIRAQRELLDSGKGAEKARATRAVEAWEQGRLLRREALEIELGAAYRRLERLEAPIPEGERETEVYLLRRFTWREQKEVEDEFTTLDTESERREVDKIARNMKLLKVVLSGRQGADGTVIPVDPEELEAGTAGVLISRMWSKNTLQPDLIAFLRGGGGARRRGAAAP